MLVCARVCWCVMGCVGVCVCVCVCGITFMLFPKCLYSVLFVID